MIVEDVNFGVTKFARRLHFGGHYLRALSTGGWEYILRIAN